MSRLLNNLDAIISPYVEGGFSFERDESTPIPPGPDFNGHEYVDLGLPSGNLWAKFNVGASTDPDKESFYGNYYAWGEINDKENYNWSTYKFGEKSPFLKYDPDKDELSILELTDDVAHLEMGGDWHMPDSTSVFEMTYYTTNEWITDYNGVEGLNGRLFTSKINGATLFIPAAGYMNNSTLIVDGVGGDYGFIWSSSLNGSNPDGAMELHFNKDDCRMYQNLRCYGLSVRGVIS